MLSHARMNVTQATLSRDLRDLGVVKGPRGYLLPNHLAGPPAEARHLERLLPAELLAAAVGGNLVVLRTQPGHANALAVEIDKAQLREALGTIAGDDTIFIAARGPGQARRLLRRLRRSAGLI
jgi:transcriptional regulator of arginine metabolism